MGGNALKNVPTRRYSRSEYFELANVLQEKMEETEARVNVIQAYEDKESFGDLDIMIEYKNGIDYNALVQSFNPKEVYKNGKVHSFEYKEFQIDMIVTRAEFFDFGVVYYSFNDLGNLMGRIAHKLGMKYGHEGLTYTYRDENNNILGDILLTATPQAAFAILGYDWNRYTKGFKNLEEIFEFVSSSKYFNKDIFNLDNRNHRARTRDRKRPTYTAFLEYCELNNFDNNYQYSKDKTQYWSLIQSSFPHFRRDIESLQAKEEKRKLIKDKFNGVIVNELTGLQGKELGAFMSSFKKQYAELAELSPDDIKKTVVEFKNELEM